MMEIEPVQPTAEDCLDQGIRAGLLEEASPVGVTEYGRRLLTRLGDPAEEDWREALIQCATMVVPPSDGEVISMESFVASFVERLVANQFEPLRADDRSLSRAIVDVTLDSGTYHRTALCLVAVLAKDLAVEQNVIQEGKHGGKYVLRLCR
jgi:hypothetical protein